MAVLLPLFSKKKRIVVKKSLENRPTAHVKQHTQLVRRQCTVFSHGTAGVILVKILLGILSTRTWPLHEIVLITPTPNNRGGTRVNYTVNRPVSGKEKTGPVTGGTGRFTEISEISKLQARR
jgi:hypothetical protein